MEERDIVSGDVVSSPRNNEYLEKNRIASTFNFRLMLYITGSRLTNIAYSCNSLLSSMTLVEYTGGLERKF